MDGTVFIAAVTSPRLFLVLREAWLGELNSPFHEHTIKY